MKTTKPQAQSIQKSPLNALNLLLLALLLFTQTPVFALQLESVAMRNMNTFKKFDGLAQNAIVIKARDTHIKYLDRIEFATGELENGDTTNAFISVGPTWRFSKRVMGSGLAFIELGTSPTWINDDEFNNEYLGGNLFFTSNVQMGMHFGRHRELSVSVRIHHISNGGLNSKNPGTDMIGVELSYLLGR